MARAKYCPKPPQVKLNKAKRRKRATKTAPDVNTDEHFMICATGDKDCPKEAKSRGARAAFVTPSRPGRAADPEGFTFQSGSPCGGDRFAERDPKKCPVQTFWQDGVMHIRFCQDQKQKGKILKLGDDPKKTKSAVTRACRHWKKHLTWDGYAPLKKAGLGKPKRKKRSA